MKLIDTLRIETMPLHQDIEALPLFKKILSKQISLSEYIGLLKKFYQFIYSCEKFIMRTDHQYLISSRQKSFLLRTDLIELNVPYKDWGGPCTKIPKLLTEEEILGYLYVLEGSTLGGQIITKLLQESLKLSPKNGVAYFYGYGNKTKLRWLEFHRFLLNFEHNNDSKKLIVASAINTFAQLKNHLC